MKNNLEFKQMNPNETEQASDLKLLFKNIVPGDPYFEIKGDTLIVSGEMAFIHNMRDKGFDILDFLKKDPRFEDITLPKTDSKISIFSKLKEPIEGINNVEIYINKDM